MHRTIAQWKLGTKAVRYGDWKKVVVVEELYLCDGDMLVGKKHVSTTMNEKSYN